MSFRSKREFAVELSKLKGFTDTSNNAAALEQYATPSEIAAAWLWQMALNGELSGRIILDAGSGPGILGIGALLLGAKKVYFLDLDQHALQICQENYHKVFEEYEIGEVEFINSDISLFHHEADGALLHDEHDNEEAIDIVLQNPPFGTKEKHSDKAFLEKAFHTAPLVYSMHKANTRKFVEAISKDFNFTITDFWRFKFPLKAKYSFHTKNVEYIEVGLWRMEKLAK